MVVAVVMVMMLVAVRYGVFGDEMVVRCCSGEWYGWCDSGGEW